MLTTYIALHPVSCFLNTSFPTATENILKCRRLIGLAII